MIKQFRFYIKHSLNDLLVNKQRTLFALLCIAAGVAAIVSLQTLAAMIGSTLSENLQERNAGDIQIQAGFELESDEELIDQGLENGFLIQETMSFMGFQEDMYFISPQGVDMLREWAEAHYPGEIEITYRQPLAGVAGILSGAGTGDQITRVSPIVVDTQVYPFYDEINAEDGTPLAEAIQDPTDILVSDEIVDVLGLEPGDEVRINGSDATFTIRGVVSPAEVVKDPTSADAFGALFGFYLIDHSAVELFDDVDPSAEIVYLKLANPDAMLEVNRALTEVFPYASTINTEDLAETYEDMAKVINDLVSVMGLVALLIGSIGIINTMQVIVRRRTVEVAVLKTLGLQADQVTILFMVEAFIMGVVGSVAGILLGWALTFVIKGAAETFIPSGLTFQVAPQPAINGFIVGTLVTMIFGFMPTLAAGQVRPALVLRPSDRIIPRAGWLQTLGALVVIIFALTLVAQTVLGSFSTALGVTAGAFVAAGVLYVLLTLLIWLIGRFFPSLGLVDLKISLRQMLAGRRRAATTLLALVVGVFSLSLITLMAESIAGVLDFALSEGAGGNVLITTSSEAQLEQVEQLIADFEGAGSYKVFKNYSLEIVSLERAETGATLTRRELDALMEANHDASGDRFAGGMFGSQDEEINYIQILDQDVGSIGLRTPDQLVEQGFEDGRQIAPEDVAGDVPGLVIVGTDWVRYAGIGVGDRITYAYQDDAGLAGMAGMGGGEDADEGDADAADTITFEIIGIIKMPAVQIGFGSDAAVYTLEGAFPEDHPPTSITVGVQVAEEEVNVFNRKVSEIPGAFALPTAVVHQLLDKMLSVFIAFPTMVAALGLAVGGVVIANSVALTTMERRREIAIMKAVGLQRERVLFMLLLENGVLGLIGGLIGVGIGLVALALFVVTIHAPGSTLPVGTALLLMGLCILVALVAAVFTAWPASGEKPLNVLRYE
jgi:ABC-type antimicrobial peptide transport system permease subunit